MKQDKTEGLSFEAAFQRLEEILEKMNSGELSLDESLKTYEEADRLIAFCSTKLNEAELRIETLIKNREGELVLDSGGAPMTHDFTPPSSPSAYS